MMRFFWISALVALFACKQSQPAPTTASTSTAETAAAAKPAPAARKTILFFGNSLTAAYNLSPEQGFTALIQQKIDSLGLPYTCVNAGLSGETTTDGRNRVQWVLDNHSVDVFVLELGGNDALRGQPVAKAKENLQAIIQTVREKHPEAKIVVAGMQAPPNLGKTYTAAFSAMYPALAKANEAALIPFLLDKVGGNPSLNLPDGIHPNVAGQKIVAETVWRVLQPLL